MSIGSGPPKLFAISVGLATYECERLTRIAELAYSHRNIKALEQAARELLAFDSDVGLYYLAISAKWHGRTDEARKLFESVRGPYQSRAIHTLGAIHFESGRFDEAAQFYNEAMRVDQGRDVVALVNFRFQVSAIKSAQGKHEQSLDDLLSLYPVVRVAAKHQPHLWPTLYNEIACELLELGRIDEAERAVSLAVNSPLAHAYPEIAETAREIAENERRAILVVPPACKQKIIIRFQFVGPCVRQTIIQPLARRATVTCSIVERVTVCAPCHAPPFQQS
ncbi:MAG TPA: tetratricopeptide repeat protein [Blastocatellia bacterium]|nr:tetratricopeptide repeat protein [Blastocatellia bacterium]